MPTPRTLFVVTMLSADTLASQFDQLACSDRPEAYDDRRSILLHKAGDYTETAYAWISPRDLAPILFPVEDFCACLPIINAPTCAWCANIERHIADERGLPHDA
jgi:hypothetical protein